MNREEARRKLFTLPWQALFDLALEKQIDEDEIKSQGKSEILRKLLLTNITESEIDATVDNYIYGMRVTFTLWGFSRNLNETDLLLLKRLEGTAEDQIDVDGFRNLQYLAVKECPDRLEIVYSYSKEYSYINEDGHTSSIWELHRGSLWVGTEKNYLASISKHEKMMSCVLHVICNKLHVGINQLKPPKKAIERCTNYKAMSRIVLQGTGGEKTAISNSEGFTPEQKEEMERIRGGRFDTSGSYIASITDETTATVKYNVNKGSLGIYKHLPSSVLFDWSNKAIEIILEEIENLKGKPAVEIYNELGIKINWPGCSTDSSTKLDWFLTQVIASLDNKEEYRITIPDHIKSVLQNEKLFTMIPRVYCNDCDSYEIPYCAHCGEPLTYNRRGSLECSCDAPLQITCSEHHNSCVQKPWYLPMGKTVEMINSNLCKLFRNQDLNYSLCIMDDDLFIVHSDSKTGDEVEIQFADIVCFQNDFIPDESIKSFVVRMKEKCNGSCSYKKIEKCITDANMYCLPKAFYGILPGFRPQPHKGSEFGDISGQIQVGDKHYQMIGIIKKNSENKVGTNCKPRTGAELIQRPLLSTSKEGQEIIRQFVEQGMVDNRAEAIAIVIPQYIDHGLKGTLRMLARFASKKIIFIELNELCQLIPMNQNNIQVK